MVFGKGRLLRFGIERFKMYNSGAWILLRVDLRRFFERCFFCLLYWVSFYLDDVFMR